jgi:1-acyl-sn-glycerol-3-phosphate acyltransferase
MQRETYSWTGRTDKKLSRVLKTEYVGFLPGSASFWIPVLPVTVNGSMKVLAKGSLVFCPGPIEVVVGEPIDTLGYTPERLEELMEQTRAVTASNLETDYSSE